jgi:hypothetical protein
VAQIAYAVTLTGNGVPLKYVTPQESG